MTPEGRERPIVSTPLDAGTLERINAVCPGMKVGGADPAMLSGAAILDTVWGPAAC